MNSDKEDQHQIDDPGFSEKWLEKFSRHREVVFPYEPAQFAKIAASIGVEQADWTPELRQFLSFAVWDYRNVSEYFSLDTQRSFKRLFGNIQKSLERAIHDLKQIEEEHPRGFDLLQSFARGEGAINIETLISDLRIYQRHAFLFCDVTSPPGRPTDAATPRFVFVLSLLYCRLNRSTQHKR